MREIGHFIGGKAVKGAPTALATSFDPNTGEVRPRSLWPNTPRSSTPSPMRRRRSLPGRRLTRSVALASCSSFSSWCKGIRRSRANCLSSEHGKTIPDARGDIQRGVEVVEFACGIPHLLKGEYTEGAGPGDRPLLDPPAAWRRRRHHAVQFSGNDPDVEIRARDRVRQCLHSRNRPSAILPSRCVLPNFMIDAGLPPGVLNVVNGDKEAGRHAADRPARDGHRFRRIRRTSLSTFTRPAALNGKRVQCFGGAKNHMIVMPDADMDQAVDALVGAGYGSAGERCMAVSVAVPVGKRRPTYSSRSSSRVSRV